MSSNDYNGYWHVQIGSKNDLVYKLQHRVTMFTVKKRHKCKLMDSEMGVGVTNWPLNYRCLVKKLSLTLKLLNIFYILKQRL